MTFKMEKKLIILTLTIISLISCSKSDDYPESSEIIEGLRVTINNEAKIFHKVWVEEYVYEKGTVNEYSNLIVHGEIEPNSQEKIFFALVKGKTGTEVISSLHYYDSKYVPYYYERSTNGGSFFIDVISNDGNNLLKGKFNGTLQQNGGGTILTFKNGSFNIKY